MIRGIHAALLSTCLLAPPAGGQDAAPDADRPDVDAEALRCRHPLRIEVPSQAEDPLLAYGWDGAEVAPARFGTGPVVLTYGPRPITGWTLADVPFDEGRGDEAGARAGAVSARLEGHRWTTGRFGNAVELPDDDGRIQVTVDSPLPESWTLELWVRPASLDERVVLLGWPGVVELALLPEGVRASFATDPPITLRSYAVAAGEWHHVAVTIEDEYFHQARLTVDGDPRGKSFQRAPAALELPIRFTLFGPGRAFDQLSWTARAKSSVELAESWRCDATCGTHELTLRYASGQRLVHPWAGVLEAASPGDVGWEHGRLEHVVASGDGLRWVPGHWEELRTDRRPLPRTTHPTVYVGGGRSLVFGGETRDTHLPPMVNTDDTWLFRRIERGRGEWTRVGREPAPDPACHQGAAYSPDHDLVLYAGGWRNDEQGPLTHDGTWVFHVAEARWEERQPSGADFDERRDAAVVYHASARRFLLFLHSGAVMTYDPEADHWERLQREVREPKELDDLYRPRGSPMIGYDPDSGKVFLFGGVNPPRAARHYNDFTATYDLSTNRYEVLHPERAPAARVRAGFAYDSRRRRFVLFGGVQDQYSVRNRDLWALDPRTGQWQELGCSNAPSRRGGYYGMSYDPEQDRFLLLCGRSEVQRFLDDAWSLHLDEGAPGRAVYAFDRAALAPADRFRAIWSTPAGAEVRLSFRSGPRAEFEGAWSPDAESVRREDRFVQVQVELLPGPDGAGPSVRELGFVAGAAAAELRAGEAAREVRFAPYEGGGR